MSWAANKDHLLKLEAAGTASQGQIEWLARWRALGSPSTREGMKSGITQSFGHTGEGTGTAYSESSGINPAEDNPYGVESVTTSDGSGFSGNEEHFITNGNPEEMEGVNVEYMPDWLRKGTDWNSLSTWEKNAKWNIDQVRKGKANANQQSWYDSWKAAGSPHTKDEMNSWKKAQSAGSTTGNPGGMLGSQVDVVKEATNPNTTTPVKDQPAGGYTGPTAQEIAEAQIAAAKAAAAQAAEAKETERAERAAAMNEWAAGQSKSQYTKKYGNGQGSIMDSYNKGRGNPVAPKPPMSQPTGGSRSMGPQTPVRPSSQPTGGWKPPEDTYQSPPVQPSTPWADAFLRSKKAAEAPGPVSGMMSKWME